MIKARHILSFILLTLSLSIAAARTYKVEEIPNVHLADRTRFTSNPDNIISFNSQTRADSIMSRLRRTTSVEMVTVIVDDIDGSDIDTYANQLFNLWGLGKKDNNNGVLMLVARDAHKAVIRTGPGVEGVLTDIFCGRVLRDKMFPRFKEENFDGGVISGLEAIEQRLSNPTAADEVRSELDDSDFLSGVDPFHFYLLLSLIVTIAAAIAISIKLISLKGKASFDKYTSFESWKAPLLVLSFGGVGIPLIVTLPLLLMLRYWRNKPRKCPNCGERMIKIDEVHDNDYLTPAQDCEERIGSVDYDVWHCPACGETDIFPFVNKSLPLSECDNCHARTARLTSDKVLIQPTAAREGVGQKEYSCLNCHHKTLRRYNIAKLPPVIIVPGTGGRGGFGGGGGSVGGGFGGGFTGGGGASGGW